MSWTEGSDYILIDKTKIIESTLEFLDAYDFLKEIKIKFVEETVSDAGGLIREWVQLVTNGLFKKNEQVFSTDS